MRTDTLRCFPQTTPRRNNRTLDSAYLRITLTFPSPAPTLLPMACEAESSIDIPTAARRLNRRRAAKRALLRERLARAEEDAGRIIGHIAATYRPLRIRRWGSLVHTERFSELSDIDIALEGLAHDETTIAAIRDDAEAMTEFPVDIVALERVEPGRADLIRRFGRVVWEREDG